MKKICILFLLSTLLSCAKYPHVPYLVGESHFNIDTIKRMAPYKMSNDVLAENEYAIYNLPPNISGVNKRKDWEVIVEKYNADLTYFYAIKGDNIYIYRNVTIWKDKKNTTTMELSAFFDLLKEEGIDIKECEIITQSTWDREYIRDVLLFYKGVKHNIRLGRSEISIRSYLKSDEAYWESQGSFMPDTPADIREKWRKEHN